MKFRIPVITLLISATLTGCATREFRQADQQADRDYSRAQALSERDRAKPVSSLVWVNEPWINPQPLQISTQAKKTPLPACSLTLVIDGSISLHEAGQRITRSCGLPVYITPDVAGAAAGTTGTTQSMAGELPRPDDSGRPLLAGIGAQTGSPVALVGIGRLSSLDWQGPLGGLLDQMAARMGISWRYENGSVIFHYLDTRTFRLKVLNSESAMTASLTGTSNTTSGSGDSAGSSSQDSGQSTTVKMVSNLHTDIAASVKAIISPAGNWHLSGSTGELVVTDVPQVLDRIGRYVDALNIRMNRMVRFKVSVYSVKRTDTSQTALDWSAVVDRLDRFGMALTGAATTTTQVASAQINVLNGKFAGTTALIRALESQGKTSMTMNNEAVTTNLVPAPIQVATSLVYLKKQDTTVSDSYATTTLEPGTITTGTQLTLLPDIREEGDIQLQFNFSHSDPAQIRKVQSEDGNTRMEMPWTTVRSLTERVNLRPGQTLFVSGYNASNLSVNREGTLTPDNPVAGGGKSSDRDSTIMVIAITPELM